MVIRFRRSLKVAPGVRLNLGKRSASVRFGPRGMGLTTGTRGARVSAGVPGTGLYASKKLRTSAKTSRKAVRRSPTNPRSVLSEPRSQGANMTEMTLVQVVRSLGPPEEETQFPRGWLTWTIILGVLAIPTAGVTLLLAAPFGFVVWKRTHTPTYQAFNSIRRAAPSPEGDRAVVQAASSAPDSWSVQRAAGLYFLGRGIHDRVGRFMEASARLYQGDRRSMLLVASQAAINVGKPDHVVRTLEPYVRSANPDDDPLDVLILSLLASSLYQKGDAGRALEVVNRLPLRRRNLDQPLLVGLCVRAMAKHTLGKKADAKRDFDRVYAADPAFPMLAEVKAKLAQLG